MSAFLKEHAQIKGNASGNENNDQIRLNTHLVRL